MSRALSTAEERRETVIESAIAEFARGGYRGTTYAAVAARASISVAYVFKLFPGKQTLFVAALDRCFERVAATLTDAAQRTTGGPPATILDAMGGAYAELLADRDLLLLQVHAQSATDTLEIRDALRRGLELVTRVVTAGSGAAPAEVQRFVAWGQLCHLVVAAGLNELDDEWATTLAAGLRHVPAA